MTLILEGKSRDEGGRRRKEERARVRKEGERKGRKC